MAVKLVSAVCPNCGAQIEVPSDRPTCFCTYCGGQVIIDDGSQNINIHNYDEAEMRRIELDAEESRKFEEAQEAFERKRGPWRVAVVCWLIIVAVLVVVSEAVEKNLPDLDEMVDLLSGCVLFFGLIALLVLKPRRPRRRNFGRSSRRSS